MKIAKLISVTDTRQFEEQGDRWVPIPGSGQENECARCKRLHEVHALVELSDGTTRVIGTGCAKGTGWVTEMRRAGNKAAKAAASAAKLRWIQEVALPTVFKLQCEIEAEASTLEITEGTVTLGERVVKTWELGGQKLWRQLGNAGMTKEQARAELLGAWKRSAFRVRWDGPSLQDLQARERKLQKILG